MTGWTGGGIVNRRVNSRLALFAIFTLSPAGCMLLRGQTNLPVADPAMMPAAVVKGETPDAKRPARAVLRKASEVRALPLAEVAFHPEVRLRGIVTCRWQSRFVLQDEATALWVRLVKAPAAVPPATGELPELGSVVEVDGMVEPPPVGINLGTVVRAQRVRVVGKAPLPPVHPLIGPDLAGSGAFFQRCAIDGDVTYVEVREDLWIVKLRCEVGSLYVHVLSDPSLDRTKFLGARLRAEGVLGCICNLRGEFVVGEMWAASTDLQVLIPPAKEEFAAPNTPLDELARFMNTSRGNQHRRVQGTVTYCSWKTLYLQEGSTALRVRVNMPVEMPLGTRLDAVGYLDFSRPVAGLSDAVIRRVGTAPLPPPVELSMPILLQSFSRTEDREPCDYDGRLVWMKGRLTTINHEPGEGWRLIVNVDGDLVMACVASRNKQWSAADRVLALLRPGSLVRLTGVADPQYEHDDPKRWNSAVPVDLNLLLRGPEDVTVLEPVAWWTWERIGMALAVALAVALGGTLIVILWVRQLQGTVRRQAVRIEESLRSYRNAELEQEAIRKERFRLAADLHDGLQQHLASASYRLEAGIQRLGEVPAAAREQFVATLSALERTSTELRECLEGIRGLVEGPIEFPALVRHTLGSAEHWPQASLHVRDAGQPFPLSHSVAGSLLLFVREAVGNAFRHARPSRVDVEIRYLADAFEIEVRDDGIGFDEAAAEGDRQRHLGLETMRHRLRWLGGSARIASRPGEGTRVIGQLSRAAAQVGIEYPEVDESVGALPTGPLSQIE